MKKTYISPLLTLVGVQAVNVIALSTGLGEAQQNREVLVKDDAPVIQNYNVWDDDWSK